MGFQRRLRVDTIRTAAFGAIGAAYSAVGTALDSTARIFCLTNLTDQDVYFSIDGVNDHFIVPSNSFKLIDITANTVKDYPYFLAEGTVFYVSRAGGAPTTGNVYVEVIRN